MPQAATAQKVFSFQEANIDLEWAGGKGSNLIRLVRADFPVPDGFIISTWGYSFFVDANQLALPIEEVLNRMDAGSPDSLMEAANAIKRMFEAAVIPEILSQEILRAYTRLGSPPVAVRSSATAEDLPDLSFAGQQDTFLNVIGDDSLLKAVVQCWASLWTARAMGYRARNLIAHESVQLGVVVQRMVNSQSSGVLFTANPLTGMRSQTVIDATLGLGEALVSGQVEPDHYLVDSASGSILSKTLGSKTAVTRIRVEGGVETVHLSEAVEEALTDEQVKSLTALGRKAAVYFGCPQDIEWAVFEDEITLLQSRPITSLFPVPQDIAGQPLRVMLSFGAVQGLLAPITSLGQEAICYVISGGAGLFDYHVSPHTQSVIRAAGERLWLDITGMFHNRIGRKLMDTLLFFVEPGSAQVIKKLLKDPRLPCKARTLRLDTFIHLLYFFVPQTLRVLSLLIAPERGRERLQRQAEEHYQAFARQSMAVVGDDFERLSARITFFKHLMEVFPIAMPTYAAGLMAGMASFNILAQLENHVRTKGGPSENLYLQATRGLPNNVTTEMDLALWHVAVQIRGQRSTAAFMNEKPEKLASDYLAGTLPLEVQQPIANFMNRYGMRGLGEIDIGRWRWREDPAPVMQSLQSYLRIEDPAQGPDVVFKQGEQQAQAAIERLSEKLTRTPFGPIKVFVARAAYRRMRALMGLRESPKFYIIRTMGVIRDTLLASGADFVRRGVIKQPDDLFFLKLDELERLASGDNLDFHALILNRRAIYDLERRRSQIPRVLLSSGEAFYNGVEGEDLPASNGRLIGSPVSPGVIEGYVRVVLDPNGAQLTPGEILVCPGTDPSWTPLFLAAGGLVMEVGGMMTHGSVVAREYGIPAVVGVQDATKRLLTGQLVRVNGSTGSIEILEVD